jgi:pimeloyl-ACP methyl ester carboxylesterase
MTSPTAEPAAVIGPAVRSGYVMNAGNPLNYLEWGAADAPPVVLLHGLRGFAYSWRAIAERLADQYRCVALNLRGHGDSGPSPERDLTIDLYVTDVESLASQLQLARFTLVGHSLGGRVAMAYAAAHPKRTRGIVVVDIAPGLTDEGVMGIKRGMEASPPGFPSWEEAVAFSARGRANVPAATLAEWAPYTFRRLPDGTITWKHDPLLREEWLGPELPPRAKVHLWDELARVECPVLIVRGQTSHQLDAALCERMVGSVRDGQWVEIPDTSHFVHHDNPDAFLAAVTAFLEADPVDG